LQELQSQPRSAWRQVELKGVSRQYKTPRIFDQRIALPGYAGPIRQKVALRGAIAITDLGHEEPTLLLTNQLRRAAAPLIERYARRMLIENNIEDGVHFFHKVALRGAIDALSSAVALKVNCDVQLTLMASSLYRFLAQQKVALRGAIGNGYESAKSVRLFRDFKVALRGAKVALRGAIEASALIEIRDDAITVNFQKRAHNPLLLAAGFHNTDVHVPWLDRRLLLKFG